MALVRRQLGAKRKTFFLVAFVLAAGGLLYYLIPATSTTLTPGTDPATTRLQEELQAVQKLDERLSADVERLLTDVRFQELTQFGELPVRVGETGKINPFLP